MSAEGTTFTRRLKFIEVGPEKVAYETINVADDGAPLGAAATSTTTWTEIVKHATSPEARTVITDERITVAAGDFDCMLYTITERRGDKTMVTRAWYAKDLPGAPIKLLVEFQGMEVFMQELMAHDPGGRMDRAIAGSPSGE